MKSNPNKVRSGIRIREDVKDLVDHYRKNRGTSFNKALEEIVFHLLAPEALEVRKEVIESAIEKTRQELEVTDGNW